MSSLQGDDLQSQPSSGPGVKRDGAPSLTMSTNDEEYGFHRNDGEDPELDAAELSEQEPVDSTGGMYRARARGNQNTKGDYIAKDRDAKSIALKLTSMIEGSFLRFRSVTYDQTRYQRKVNTSHTAFEPQDSIIQQTQTTLEGFMSNISEIDSSSLEVMEELQNAKDWGEDRKCKLEEDRDKVHQAVCRVLEVLNVTNPMMDIRPQLRLDSDDGDH